MSALVLPAKYAGVTPREWTVHNGADARSYGYIRCDKRVGGTAGVAVARVNTHGIGRSQADSNALLISDAPRLAAAVVEQRAALLAALEYDGGTGYDSTDDEIGRRQCCGVLSYRPHQEKCWTLTVRAALANSAEWAV